MRYWLCKSSRTFQVCVPVDDIMYPFSMSFSYMAKPGWALPFLWTTNHLAKALILLLRGAQEQALTEMVWCTRFVSKYQASAGSHWRLSWEMWQIFCSFCDVFTQPSQSCIRALPCSTTLEILLHVYYEITGQAYNLVRLYQGFWRCATSEVCLQNRVKEGISPTWTYF